MSEAALAPVSGKRCLQAPRTAPPRRARCCHFTTLLRPTGACRAGEFPLVNSGVTRSAPRGAQRAPTVGPGPLRVGTAPADRGPWALGPDSPGRAGSPCLLHGGADTRPALGSPGRSRPELPPAPPSAGAHVWGCAHVGVHRENLPRSKRRVPPLVPPPAGFAGRPSPQFTKPHFPSWEPEAVKAS